MQLIRVVGRAALRLLQFAMYIVWGLAGVCLLSYSMVSLYIAHLDGVLGDASAINGRGDEVTATTQSERAGSSSAKTVIRLKEASRWFATTLLVARSRNYLVGFKWRGNDRLELTLDFGCTAQLGSPVQQVGPIQIVYRFDRSAVPPDHGYSSFPRESPRKPCK
jgi:hypothetical protein